MHFAFCIGVALTLARAQPSAEQRLLDRTPFDRIVLNQAGGGAMLDVMPLELPQRPLASIPASGTLTVRLLDRPTEDFLVSWTHIERVRVFEELLLDEARRLTAAGNFDAAYDYFARLLAQHPKLPGLDQAINDYLRRNALALYQGKQYDRALAVLLTLHQRSPNYAGLANAVETVAAEIIQRHLREGNYAAARGVLELWQNQFRGIAAASAAQWQRRFEAAATRQVDEAARLIQEKQYVAARNAANKALAIWPRLETAGNVLAQISREFPFVTVGVLETAPREPARRIDNWAAIRAARLTQRMLAEQVDFGAEGGMYQSPFGELSVDETGRVLSVKLNPALSGGLTADAWARYLLAVAQAGHAHHRVDLATMLSGVSITPAGEVEIHLERIHVRPEAMLQLPPPATRAAEFSIADYGPDQVVFAAAAASHESAGLQAVVERTMPDDESAVAALLAGDIDVLDRVPPWQVERLRAAPDVRVESYRLPTVHVLIPNAGRPLLAKREFRRALCFGTDRDWIVQRVLLGGATVPGFEAISGPFPAGTSLSDPVRYGYNNRIAPRPFEPRLAAVLATVAWASVHNPDGEERQNDPGDIPELVLAHPRDPVARVACQSIQAQLARQGMPIKLLEFTADELVAGTVEYDLRYAELAMWEPVSDARLVMGPGSLTSDVESPYLDSALRQLDEATNWNDVRARLADLHEIAHHELPVIPLWQTINHFAYRTSIRGIGRSPITLYQNIEQWSPTESRQVARRDPSAP